jgi:4,5-dihydroxyphthalate decarboxylase
MTYTVVLGNSPHALAIKNGTIRVPGPDLVFPEIDPVHKAFAPMVRELKYDFSEMAIATYLQAREAGKPISLLPVVLVGDFHHRSLVRLPDSGIAGPRDLIGRRVGVRAYSQTTGMWVRGALLEEFGVAADQITWVTTEGPHVAEYTEPAFVERTTRPLTELLRDGDIAAMIPAPASQLRTVPVIPDADAAARAWGNRHHTKPVNHMLTVRTELIDTDPGAVRALYQAFAQAGLNDELQASLELAIRYAREQDLLSKPVTVDEILADFRRLEKP